MNHKEVNKTLEGLYFSLKTIEVAVELRQQTDRLRNLLDRGSLDRMTANCVLAFRKYNDLLEKQLAD